MVSEKRLLERKRRAEYRFKGYEQYGITTRFWETYVIPCVLKRDCYKCLKCGSKKNLDVSHKRYGIDITIKDLETLCRSCHKLKDNYKGELKENGFK